MITEEISGWLQDVDQNIPPKNQTVRSYSLGQSKSNKENTSKRQIQKKQNSTIEELKKVMEFLSINEQYKYETHRIFNTQNFEPKCQEDTQRNKFRLNVENIPPAPKSRLKPLNDCLQQKVYSERIEKATIDKLPKFIIKQKEKKYQIQELTPKPKQGKNFLQQQLMSNSYDHFFKKAIHNLQEAKERQRQLKSLQSVLKFKQIK